MTVAGREHEVEAYWISCGLSSRTASALFYEGITTKEQLRALDPRGFWLIPKFGLKGVRELEQFMGLPSSPTPNGTRLIVTRLTDGELIEEMERRGFSVRRLDDDPHAR